MGHRAVRAGLADRVETLAQVLARLGARKRPATSGGSGGRAAVAGGGSLELALARLRTEWTK